MLTISHRGYCQNAIENTLEAFGHAASLGVDGIETDIRLTSDGCLVLFHDRRLQSGQSIRELSYSGLCKAAGYAVPKLEDALVWSDSLIWVLELKDPTATKQLISVLKQFNSSHRLLVTSFCHQAMADIRQHVDVECAVNVSHRPKDFCNSDLRQWQTIVWKYEFIDAQLIRESATSGHRNLVFDVEGQEEHLHCQSLGIDGIITDQPQLVAEGGALPKSAWPPLITSGGTPISLPGTNTF